MLAQIKMEWRNPVDNEVLIPAATKTYRTN